MSFGIVMLHLLAIAMLATLISFSLFRKEIRASAQLVVCASAALVWSVSSFAELMVPSFEAKLFWRNVTQLGTYFSPPAVVCFSLAYIHAERRLRRLIGLGLYALASVPIALVWTDWAHGLMRVSVGLSEAFPGLETVYVKPTLLGDAFISLNYIEALGGLMILLVYAFKQSQAERKATLIAAGGMSLPWLFSLVKSVFGELSFGGLPSSTAFAFGGFVILFGVLKAGFLGLGTVGRDRAFEVVSEGILVFDTGHRLVDSNPAARALLSRALDLPPETGLEAMGERFRAELGEGRASLLAGEELRLKFAPAGRASHLALRAFELKSGKNVVGLTCVLRDVTSETRRLDDLKALAELDPLTGAYNKAAFEGIVSEILGRSAGGGCLMLFDVDRFKDCNDSKGHLAGDAVLRGISRLCRESLRDGDVLGRVGGDEFALFLAGANEQAASVLAERVRSLVSEACFDSSGGPLTATISVGAAVVADDQPEAYESLFARADSAMYKSKAKGRNAVSLAPGALP